MALFRKDNTDYLSRGGLSVATLAHTCKITEEPNVSSDNQSGNVLAGVSFLWAITRMTITLQLIIKMNMNCKCIHMQHI